MLKGGLGHVILSADLMGLWAATLDEKGAPGCKPFIFNTTGCYFHATEGLSSLFPVEAEVLFPAKRGQHDILGGFQ